ncbi:hypothetical protein FGG08_002405 [Glutinoglossum americanum]|uniref:Uncharacterized protein n=1 Tax=Glutinoglossum americanum TaxID=1670608 RepID=A0A9P8I4V1_9PEZI|nr:hypothetical protein FGG08_002405 [Glutinoglossum americanum]
MVIDAMRTWKHESQFADFMNEQATFPSIQPSPTMGLGSHRGKEPRREDLTALQHTFASLQRVGSYLVGKHEETQHLNELMSFIRSLRQSLPVKTPAEQFELLHPLRSWLLWLPIAYSRRVNRDPSVVLLLAHFYAVALAVEPLFPAVGAAYFGSLSVSPIEEIYRKLARLEVSNSLDENVQTPMSLMQFPLEMVTKFRARMDFVSPNSAPYPSLASSPYDVGSLELDAEGEFVELESSYEGPFNLDNVTPVTSSPDSGLSALARRSRIFETQLCHSLDGFNTNSFTGYNPTRDSSRFVTGDSGLYDPLPMDFNVGLVVPTLWT